VDGDKYVMESGERKIIEETRVHSDILSLIKMPVGAETRADSNDDRIASPGEFPP
jgi:hypothetical protein